MTPSIGENHFNDQDFVSIKNHAEKLVGLSLREIATRSGKDYLPKDADKGGGGQLLQAWFGLRRDNRPEPDLLSVKFSDGNIVGIEIKGVPLSLRKGGLRIKERCKVTNIDYTKLLAERWPVSQARHKLLHVLFIFYRYAGASNWADSTVEKIVWWRLDDSIAEPTIRKDWERTWDYVDKGRAHEISESHGIILAASTAGAGGDSKHVTQPKNPGDRARKRAFSLKPAFLQTTYGFAVAPNQFTSVPTLRKSSDIKGEVLQRLRKYVGHTFSDIADALQIPKPKAKHAAALFVRRAFGIKDDTKRLLELEAAGVKPKTIPVRESDLRPLEAMSFPAMRLVDFAEEEWEGSELRAYLDSLLFIPVFAKDKKQNLWERKLASPFFWTPSEDEERGIAREWEMFRQEVLSGKAAYTRTNGKRISSLTGGSKTTYIHLRPKGRDGMDDDIDPCGRKTQKLCFWLNQSFVKSLLMSHLNI